jgi:hypothetical protein
VIDPRRRPVALAFAVLALMLAGPAFAKKKKKGGAKKHKTPSGKSIGAQPKDTPDDDSSDSEDSGKEKEVEETKPSAKSSPDTSDEKSSASGEGEGGDAEAKPKKRAKPAEAEGGSGGEGTGAPAALELVVGGGGVNRSLSYNEYRETPQTLAPYSLPMGPEARVAFELYPGAFGTTGFAANIGVIGQLGYGFGVKSKASLGSSQLPTQFMDFAVGLKFRLPLGMVAPHVSASYAQQAFQLNNQNAATTGPPVPAVGYKMIRAGAGARFAFTPMIDLDVGAGFLLLTDAGQIRTLYWPHTTGTGIEGTLSLGFRLTNLIGLRAGVDYRRYGLAFNWRSGEMYQAGGALDQYITVWGGVSVTLDGVSGGESGEEAAKPEPAKSKKKKAEPELTDEPTE